MNDNANRPEAAEGAVPLYLQQPRLLDEGEGDQEGYTPLRRPGKIFMPRESSRGRTEVERRERQDERTNRTGRAEPGAMKGSWILRAMLLGPARGMW